jgi:uncharacterized protein YbcI
MTHLEAPAPPATARVPGGRLRATIANGLVGLYKEHHGRGPTKAHVTIDGPYVYAILEDGLTRGEETLIAGGEGDAVVACRARFSHLVEPQLSALVERATGRRVVAHHGHLILTPPRTVELFILDGEALDEPPPGS